eukprot:844304-Amphidinium_carterae.1
MTACSCGRCDPTKHHLHLLHVLQGGIDERFMYIRHLDKRFGPTGQQQVLRNCWRILVQLATHEVVAIEVLQVWTQVGLQQESLCSSYTTALDLPKAREGPECLGPWQLDEFKLSARRL